MINVDGMPMYDSDELFSGRQHIDGFSVDTIYPKNDDKIRPQRPKDSHHRGGGRPAHRNSSNEPEGVDRALREKVNELISDAQASSEPDAWEKAMARAEELDVVVKEGDTYKANGVEGRGIILAYESAMGTNKTKASAETTLDPVVEATQPGPTEVPIVQPENPETQTQTPESTPEATAEPEAQPTAVPTEGEQQARPEDLKVTLEQIDNEIKTAEEELATLRQEIGKVKFHREEYKKISDMIASLWRLAKEGEKEAKPLTDDEKAKIERAMEGFETNLKDLLTQELEITAKLTKLSSEKRSVLLDYFRDLAGVEKQVHTFTAEGKLSVIFDENSGLGEIIALAEDLPEVYTNELIKLLEGGYIQLDGDQFRFTDKADNLSERNRAILEKNLDKVKAELKKFAFYGYFSELHDGFDGEKAKFLELAKGDNNLLELLNNLPGNEEARKRILDRLYDRVESGEFVFSPDGTLVPSEKPGAKERYDEFFREVRSGLDSARAEKIAEELKERAKRDPLLQTLEAKSTDLKRQIDEIFEEYQIEYDEMGDDKSFWQKFKAKRIFRKYTSDRYDEFREQNEERKKLIAQKDKLDSEIADYKRQKEAVIESFAGAKAVLEREMYTFDGFDYHAEPILEGSRVADAMWDLQTYRIGIAAQLIEEYDLRDEEGKLKFEIRKAPKRPDLPSSVKLIESVDEGRVEDIKRRVADTLKKEIRDKVRQRDPKGELSQEQVDKIIAEIVEKPAKEVSDYLNNFLEQEGIAESLSGEFDKDEEMALLSRHIVMELDNIDYLERGGSGELGKKRLLRKVSELIEQSILEQREVTKLRASKERYAKQMGTDIDALEDDADFRDIFLAGTSDFAIRQKKRELDDLIAQRDRDAREYKKLTKKISDNQKLLDMVGKSQVLSDKINADRQKRSQLEELMKERKAMVELLTGAI